MRDTWGSCGFCKVSTGEKQTGIIDATDTRVNMELLRLTVASLQLPVDLETAHTAVGRRKKKVRVAAES